MTLLPRNFRWLLRLALLLWGYSNRRSLGFAAVGIGGRHRGGPTSRLLLDASNPDVQANHDGSVPSPSPLALARNALETRDIAKAEGHLMDAVAAVNGAVMNHPELLGCFEELFRTKIRVGNEALGEPSSRNGTNVAEKPSSHTATLYSVAQDRMGLASLLTDQSRYQEAARELVLAVESLSNMLTSVPSEEVAGLPTKHSVETALDNASSLLFRTRAMICDWNHYAVSSENLVASTRNALSGSRIPSVHPFEALAWPCLGLKDATSISHAYGQRALAQAEEAISHTVTDTRANRPWTRLEERLPRTNVPNYRVARDSMLAATSNTTIRVGYLSPDFTGRHPLAFLMQDVFGHHDASKFEIILYSLGGPPDGSPEVTKLLGNNDSHRRQWKTLEGSLDVMAETIREDRLDVLVDLCGYTGTSLVAEVMACLRTMPYSGDESSHTPPSKPSKPIHVAYMGFPASSGAPYIDYMIADEVVIPPEYRPLYTENILYMPHCYFVNSHKYLQTLPETEHQPPQRTDYGLPGRGFVFCCHSRPDKIDPATFGTWVRALQQTRERGRELGIPGMANAVLWLLKHPNAPAMEGNLKSQATDILGPEDASALVFCDHAPRLEHLARLALADVFLDTPAYNAHTVGCDCLAAGVPMLSLLRPTDSQEEEGTDAVATEKLASRVGASLLASATDAWSRWTGALVVPSMKAYEDRMVELAHSHATGEALSSDPPLGVSFRTLRQHLRDEFPTAPLWDTERWVRNLEVGLAAMVRLRSQAADETDIVVLDVDDDKT